MGLCALEEEIRAPRSTAMNVRNPRTGENDYVFTPTTPDEAVATTKALRAAQTAWRDGGIEHRTGILMKFAAAVQTRTEEIVAALQVARGRGATSRMEVAVLGRMLQGWCGGAKFMMPGGDYQDARQAPPGIQFK